MRQHQRRNSGNAVGEPLHPGIETFCPLCGESERWTLSVRTEAGAETDTYKLWAESPVCGKANFWLMLNANKSLARNGDGGKLFRDRNELFQSVQTLLNGGNPDGSLNAADDPYGDLVANKERDLSPEQDWNRALLYSRMTWLAQAAIGKPPDAELMAKTRWRFTGPITAAKLVEAVEFITRHEGELNRDAICEVMQAYHAGEYRPRSCERLAAMLDFVAGVGADPDGEVQENADTQSLAEENSETVNQQSRDDEIGEFVGTSVTTSLTDLL